MRTLLTFLILGALITGVSNLHAQQRTGEPNSRPVPLPPQAQKRSIPQFPIPYPEQSEDGSKNTERSNQKCAGGKDRTIRVVVMPMAAAKKWLHVQQPSAFYPPSFVGGMTVKPAGYRVG